MDPSSARVLVIGLGGLGCPAAIALAQAGIRKMTLVDFDRVELHNLPRQPLHATRDVGRRKIDSGSERLAALFPSLEIRALDQRVDAASAVELMAGHDVVIDGTDRIATKLLLSDAAVKAGVPLVYAGVVRFEGQVLLIRPGGPCLRCLFEDPSDDDVPTCAQAGVLGSVAGLVGAVQAGRAIAWLTQELAADAGDAESLWVIDAETFTARTIRLRRAADCPACTSPARLVVRGPAAESCR